MTLPPFVYSLRFWEAFSIIAAVILVRGETIDPELALTVLGAVLAVLRLVGVVPELKTKGLHKDK